MQNEKIKYFKIYRWDPDSPTQKPYLATYPVNLNEYVARYSPLNERPENVSDVWCSICIADVGLWCLTLF
jgi:hypothetical protein